MLDLVVAGGTIVDGSGGASFRADVGVRDGKIAYIHVGGGARPRSHRTVDASGLVVAPGFVDVHSHSDLSLVRDPSVQHKLLQGVTTEVIGNCGLSAAPLDKARKPEMSEYLESVFGCLEDEWRWDTLGEYLDHLESVVPAVNVATLVGHGVVRLAVMGFDRDVPRPGQLDRMKSLVAEAMREGAVGLSTGLQYAPGCYATLNELVELSRVVAEHHGIHATHMRSQGAGLLDSIGDVVAIASAAGLPVHISHLLALGRANWPKYDQALEAIRKARGRGLDITWDMYPYTAGCTMLRAALPPWVMEGGSPEPVGRLRDPATVRRVKADLGRESGDWDNISLAAGWDNLVMVQLSSPRHAHLVGRSLQEIADLRGLDPAEAVMDLLVEENTGGVMVAFVSSEENVRKALKGPHGMVGSDSLDMPGGMVHPRAYGCYPRLFGEFVRDRDVLKIEEAVRKATAVPALRAGLGGRGLIHPGFAADLVVFDLARINDVATYQQPRRAPEGVVYVVVNGVLSVEDGQLTGMRAGQVLRARSGG